MYDTNAVNAVTRAMRSEVSDHVTASEKKSLREVRGQVKKYWPILAEHMDWSDYLKKSLKLLILLLGKIVYQIT